MNRAQVLLYLMLFGTLIGVDTLTQAQEDRRHSQPRTVTDRTNSKVIPPRYPNTHKRPISKKDRARIAQLTQSVERMSRLFMLLLIPVLLIILGSLYVVFEKLGFTGWKALVPFYNLYILTQVIERPPYWLLMWCLPTIMGLFRDMFAGSLSFAMLSGIIAIVSLVYQILGISALADQFGKTRGFKWGMVLIPFIFFPLLARSEPVAVS